MKRLITIAVGYLTILCIILLPLFFFRRGLAEAWNQFAWFRIAFWVVVGLAITVLLLASLSKIMRAAGLRPREPWYPAIFKKEFETIVYPIVLPEAAPRTRRNHIICIDGTWNDPQSGTNVRRLFELLRNDDETQIARYYNGVGVVENKGFVIEDFGEEVSKTLIGCATGLGEENIRRKAYLDFVLTYKPGDRVFIFGFSRGAAIARLLVNDIYINGIPEKIESVFQKSKIEQDILRDVISIGTKQCSVEIEMMGVWDTVAAFGLPWNKIELFKHLTVAPNIKNVYHLVAIDERRKTFDVTLMNHENRIEEIWFAGAHTNVGGGFEKDRGLSDISLRFMINRASEHKIQFCDEAFQIIGKVTGLIWEAPPLWLWKITRQIHVKNGGPGVVPKIHKSVFMRKGSGNGYDPKNVKELGNTFAREERD